MSSNRPVMADDILTQDLDIMDERPLAVRRKRRTRTGLSDPLNSDIVLQNEEVEEKLQKPPNTPTKPKKRVRFSDPCPASPRTCSSSSTTGLTPYLSQTSFAPRERETSPSPRRKRTQPPARLSLPHQLSKSLPSPSSSQASTPFTGEQQFEPLRQVLDARIKRRMRRNHLSEEINDIDAEKRTETRWRRQIRDLEDQLELAKQSGLGQEQGHQGVAEAETPGSSANVGIRLSPTPEMQIYVDADANDCGIATGWDEDGGLRDIEPVETLPPNLKEAATQASLLTPYMETLRAARLSLEGLFPGEITLGLISEDPKPLLDTMLHQIRILKAQTLLAQTELSTTQTQEANLRNQFNAVLEQLDRARKYSESISMQSSQEKARADDSQVRVQLLETTVEAATSKVRELEKDTEEKDRSNQKLQDALDTYRVEVGKLEVLITSMEDEHNAAISTLRAEMDEAVADLECEVTAETTGRREAEQQVVQRDEKIQQLKVLEQELKDALNEKEQIIRETEKVFEEERVGRAREVSGLHVRIRQLSSNLAESKTRVANAEQNQRRLMQELQEERDASIRAVEAVEAKTALCAADSKDIKTAHVNDMQRRGAEVTQHNGLLTPVTTTRFKDAEGYVEARGGKGNRKKRDSGIMILEEEREDEDMIMADDM